MKWIMEWHLCRVIAFIALAPLSGHSRTVQPITYSFRTVSNDDSESSLQHSVRPVYDDVVDGDDDDDEEDDGEDDGSSKPTPTHPSMLAHHYYDPPPAASPRPLPAYRRQQNVATTPAYSTSTASIRQKKARKKPDYVLRVSYIRPTTSEGATVSSPPIPDTTTESIVRVIRVRKKGRWLKARNEIPVNEVHGGSGTAETPTHGVATTMLPMRNELTHRVRANQPTGSWQGVVAAQNVTRRLSNGWLPVASSTPTPISRKHQKPFNTVDKITASSGASYPTDISPTVAPAPKRVWNYLMHTSTTQRSPAHNGRVRNPSLDAQPDWSPSDNSVYAAATETSTAEDEFDVTMPSTGKQLMRDSSPPKMARLQPLADVLTPSGKTTLFKTTPVPKYKEAYLRRPNTKSKPKVHNVSNPVPPTSIPGQGVDSAGYHHQMESLAYEEFPALLTTAEPVSTNLAPSDSDLQHQLAVQPGTHRESLTYSDTEKTEETFQDTEYPEDEEAGTEADDEMAAPDVLEFPVKVLRKPMRYAYTTDLKSSGSSQPAHEAAESKQRKEGGGAKHRSAHHKSEGEKEEDGYESESEVDKSKKGHSDKENRKQHHEEEANEKKKHLDEGGHHASQLTSAKGEKGTAFDESGSHKKGHSTKGSHNVHKKNEYLKKHEFYDEHHEDDEHKKYGDFHKGHKYLKDHMYKKKNRDGLYSEGHKGGKGKHHNGHSFREHKGHDDAHKNVNHYANSKDYGETGHHSEGKKWKYEML